MILKQLANHSSKEVLDWFMPHRIFQHVYWITRNNLYEIKREAYICASEAVQNTN